MSFNAEEPAVYWTDAQAEAEIKKAEDASTFYKKMISDLQVQHDSVDAEANAMYFRNALELVDATPGFEAEFQRYEDAMLPWIPEEVMEGLETLDASKFSAQIAEGVLPAFPIEAYDALDAQSPVIAHVKDVHNKFLKEAKSYGVTLASMDEIADGARKAKEDAKKE
jgi:hypothetical protein